MDIFVQKDKIIKNIINIIEKYELEYFFIGIEDDSSDFYYNHIQKENDVYIIEYDYYYERGKSHSIKKPINDVSPALIIEMDYFCKKYHRYDIEFMLEMNADNNNMNSFLKILRLTRKKIDFSTVMFTSFGESSEYNKNVNTRKFQRVLFKTHPEAMDTFLNSMKDTNGEIKFVLDEYLYLNDSFDFNLV